MFIDVNGLNLLKHYDPEPTALLIGGRDSWMELDRRLERPKIGSHSVVGLDDEETGLNETLAQRELSGTVQIKLTALSNAGSWGDPLTSEPGAGKHVLSHARHVWLSGCRAHCEIYEDLR